jgi:hypothetical protein
MTNIITKNYTIQKRLFTALKETDKQKRDELNADPLTSEYLPSMKYQLVCLFTGFIFKTKAECVAQLKAFGIPLE